MASAIFWSHSKPPANQGITATDLVNGLITGTGNVQVSPAPASHLAVSGPPFFIGTAGVPFPITVTALDPFNNTAAGYFGLAHFTSSDMQAVLPPDLPLIGGLHQLSGHPQDRRQSKPSRHGHR